MTLCPPLKFNLLTGCIIFITTLMTLGLSLPQNAEAQSRRGPGYYDNQYEPVPQKREYQRPSYKQPQYNPRQYQDTDNLYQNNQNNQRSQTDKPQNQTDNQDQRPASNINGDINGDNNGAVKNNQQRNNNGYLPQNAAQNQNSQDAPIEPAQKDCRCPNNQSPVCGADGQTYRNSCYAYCNDVKVVERRACEAIAEERADEKRRILQQKIDNCVCTAEYNPVCSADGRTYSNECRANCVDAEIVHFGPCRNRTSPDNQQGMDNRDTESETKTLIDGLY